MISFALGEQKFIIFVNDDICDGEYHTRTIYVKVK